MCESHIFYLLCGHVKIKTVIQCTDITEKLVGPGELTAGNHQVCEEVSDNIYIFPDICDKCKSTGEIGNHMEVSGMKLEALRAWKSQNATDASTGSSNLDQSEQESDDIAALEAFESISLTESTSTRIPESGSSKGAPSPKRWAAPSSSKSSTADLMQIKTRVAALLERTERLLAKIRVQKPLGSANSRRKD